MIDPVTKPGPSLADPVATIQWGGTLPSGRRVAVSGLLGLSIGGWVPTPPPPTATPAAARPFNDLASLGPPLAPTATRLEWQLDCGCLAQARRSYPPCSACPRPTCAVLGSNLLGGTSLLLGLDGGRFAAQQRLDVLVPVRGFKRCVDYQNGFGAPSQRSAGVQGSPAQGVRRAFPVEVAPASLRR